mgnify:CR=1 FL=1
MKDFLKYSKDKELLVRKRINLFLEKVLRFLGYDFRHDIYKGITCFEIAVDTEFEEKIKNYYDAFIYLLNNNKNPLTISRLKKFFYILYGIEFEETLLIRLTSKLFHINELSLIEKTIEYHLYVYSQLSFLHENDRTIISLMFINYILTNNDIPCVHFLRADLIKYMKCREEYFNGNPEKMFELIYFVLKKAKFQDKSFYKKLVPLDKKDIYEKIISDKDLLINSYHINNVYLFGSYSKNTERIDSDIDILVTFSSELLVEEKKELMNKLKEHYTDFFKRYVDVHELNKYLSDVEINEFSKIKKIY